MIEFINISKKFKNNFWDKEFLAVDNVSFKLHQGDLVGFLGANGAGKTTLIKSLMDFSRPTSGSIVFDKILGSDPREIRSNIGYLPERAYLYQHLTGREFLQYTGELNRIKKNELEVFIKEWSEKIQIAHALDRHIKGYSKGMQQRLGFISALIHKPKFLVLDEPLSGLDPIGRRDFKKILKELNESGITIFFSSHIVSDVEEICNKVVFIEKGKLIYNGKIEELYLINKRETYFIKYYKSDGVLQEIQVSPADKDQLILKLIKEGANIVEIDNEKISLEEIIYKIKR